MNRCDFHSSVSLFFYFVIRLHQLRIIAFMDCNGAYSPCFRSITQTMIFSIHFGVSFKQIACNVFPFSFLFVSFWISHSFWKLLLLLFFFFNIRFNSGYYEWLRIFPECQWNVDLMVANEVWPDWNDTHCHNHTSSNSKLSFHPNEINRTQLFIQNVI